MSNSNSTVSNETILSLDYIANDASSNGTEFAEYMAANFDYISQEDGHKACVRKFNTANRTNFSAWHEVAIHLFASSEIEATEMILEITPPQELPALAAKKEVVLGFLAQAKTAEQIKEVALQNAPLFASFKSDPNFKGIKKMIYELHSIGFLVEQIYLLGIYSKAKDLAISSIKDAIFKTRKELGLTAEIAKSNKPRATKKVETSDSVMLQIDQYETILSALKLRHVELLDAEKETVDLDRIEKRESAFKALTELGISAEVAEGILSSQGK